MKKFRFVPHWHSNMELERIAKAIELLECRDDHCTRTLHCSSCPVYVAEVIRSWKWPITKKQVENCTAVMYRAYLKRKNLT
jgi:hypothetical protein